jgi:N-dimethylarginine dimethylaminohydrolase
MSKLGKVLKMNSEGSCQSMTGNLLRVMVCSPENAGWDRADRTANWETLGFHHAPDFTHAQAQHDALCGLLKKSGAEIVYLPPNDNLSVDAVYTHDASLPTNHGLILMNPGKANRVPEAEAHARCAVQLEMSIMGKVRSPANSEAGDMVWLDPRTLLVGSGYRTNQAGIAQLRELLAPHGIDVLSAPLPYGSGPSACLHLMSLMSMLDERTVLVDLPWMTVETVELLKAHGLRLIEIDYAERDTLACNVLALGGGRLVALEENDGTNRRMREAGFDVWTFPGSELCINGSGGPTCLTRPLLRA